MVDDGWVPFTGGFAVVVLDAMVEVVAGAVVGAVVGVVAVDSGRFTADSGCSESPVHAASHTAIEAIAAALRIDDTCL
jgi:hypothetical protein